MKRIYITNGCPFSGKSTWAIKNFAPDSIIESDEVKNDETRTGDLIEYLVLLANKCENNTVCIVQTDNSYRTFKRFKELLPNCEIIIANFELTLEEIKANRFESKRKKRNFKREDRLEFYQKIFLNSLDKIKECSDWTCISIHRQESNSLNSFLE